MINANRVTDDYSSDDKLALKYKAIIICKTELVVIRETVSKGPNRVEKGRDGLALDFIRCVCYRVHCMHQTT